PYTTLFRSQAGVHGIHRTLSAERAFAQRLVLARRSELREQEFRCRDHAVPQGGRRLPAGEQGARCVVETGLLPLRAWPVGQGAYRTQDGGGALPGTLRRGTCQRASRPHDEGRSLTGVIMAAWLTPGRHPSMNADLQAASARVRTEVPAARRVRITEIFHSLQGESRTAGVPTVFVRLTGCPL